MKILGLKNCASVCCGSLGLKRGERKKRAVENVEKEERRGGPAREKKERCELRVNPRERGKRGKSIEREKKKKVGTQILGWRSFDPIYFF